MPETTKNENKFKLKSGNKLEVHIYFVFNNICNSFRKQPSGDIMYIRNIVKIIYIKFTNYILCDGVALFKKRK
jgi:hypothetical protein